MHPLHDSRAFLAFLVTVGVAACFIPSADAAPAAKSSGGMPTKRPPDRERGRDLYLLSCWQCHGTEAKGDGPAAANLSGGVPSLESKVTKERFDELVKLIQDGKGPMPAYAEDIDKHDSRRILLYIQDALQGRTEARTEKDDAKGEEAGEQN